MKKYFAGLEIEPQSCKWTSFESWCLSPQDHDIPINWWFNVRIVYKLKKKAEMD